MKGLVRFVNESFINEGLKSTTIDQLMKVDKFNKDSIIGMATWDKNQGIAISEISDTMLYETMLPAPPEGAYVYWKALDEAIQAANKQFEANDPKTKVRFHENEFLLLEPKTNKIILKAKLTNRDIQLFETRIKVNKTDVKQKDWYNILINDQTNLTADSEIKLIVFADMKEISRYQVNKDGTKPSNNDQTEILNQIRQSIRSKREEVKKSIYAVVDKHAKKLGLTSINPYFDTDMYSFGEKQGKPISVKLELQSSSRYTNIRFELTSDNQINDFRFQSDKEPDVLENVLKNISSMISELRTEIAKQMQEIKKFSEQHDKTYEHDQLVQAAKMANDEK